MRFLFHIFALWLNRKHGREAQVAELNMQAPWFTYFWYIIWAFPLFINACVSIANVTFVIFSGADASNCNDGGALSRLARSIYTLSTLCVYLSVIILTHSHIVRRRSSTTLQNCERVNGRQCPFFRSSRAYWQTETFGYSLSSSSSLPLQNPKLFVHLLCRTREYGFVTYSSLCIWHNCLVCCSKMVIAQCAENKKHLYRAF